MPDAAPQPVRSPATKPLARPWYAQNLSPDDSTELMAQIANLVERGLPLPGGLRALAEERQANGRLQRSFLALASQIDAGVPIADALDHHDVALPSAERAIIVAALRSGDFAEVIEQYLASLHRAQDLNRRLRNLLLYPAFLLVLCVMLQIGLERFVIAIYRQTYEDFNLSLAGPTQAVLTLSEGVSYFLVGALFACLVVWVLLLFGSGQAFRRRLAYRAPLLGRIWQFASLSHFARLAGLLVRHAVPLPDALHLSATASGDPDLRRSIAQITPALIAGKSLSAQLAADSRLPAGLAQAVTWGEDHHAVADSLQLAAEMYEARTQSQFAFATVLGPPLALSLVVCMFGFVIISLFLPLISLIGKLA